MICETCGKVLPCVEEDETRRHYCEQCEQAKKNEAKEAYKEYMRLKNAMTIERATRRIENHKGDKNRFSHYRAAIDIVSEYMDAHLGTIASTEEAICAIVLIADEIHVKCQQKIGNHRVDFILPELKIVLEVDGYMHDYRKLKDSKRDLDIMKIQGAGWEIVRIPTHYINKYPQTIVDAIFKLKAEKQKIRKQNGNTLSPEVAKILELQKKEHNRAI